MRKLFPILFFLLLCFHYAPAQNKFHLSLGPTISYFVDADNAKPKIGLSLAFNWEFSLYKKFSLTTGVGFASRGAILENRAIEPYGPNTTNAFYQDIHGMIGYLEFPFSIRYKIRISKNITIKPVIGPALSIPIKDLSHFEKEQFFNVYIPHQSNLLDYDFWFEQESVFENNFSKENVSKIIIIYFGIQMQFSKYLFEIKYILDNRKVYYFKNLSEVQHKVNSIYLLISF